MAGADHEALKRIAEATFVGRDLVLAHLASELDEAARGRSAWWLLVGEAGIGKTRTAMALCERAAREGFLVVSGRCPEAEKAPAYRAWAQVCRSLLAQSSPTARDGLRAALGDGWRDLTALLPELAGEEPRLPLAANGDSRFLLFESVARLLATAAERTPVLVWIDDLHCADEDSLALLAFCARELASARVACLAAWRDPDPDGAPDAEQRRTTIARTLRDVPLAGFSLDEVRDLLRALLGREPSEPLVASAEARTGGNPLYLTELARMLALDGRLGAAESADFARVALPAGLREILRRRVARLSLPCQELLSRAAVLGREFERALLDAVLEPALAVLCPALLDEAHAARLLAPSGTRLAFAHALVREILYDDLAAEQRARLHASAARALAASEPGDRGTAAIAHHARAAIEVDGLEPALHWTIADARAALRRRGFADACAQYREALALLDRLEPSEPAGWQAHRTRAAELRLELADALERNGEPKEAEAQRLDVARTARVAGDGALLARAALAAAGDGMGTAQQEPDAARIALLEEAIAAAPPERTDLRVPLLARLAIELHWSFDADRRRSLAEAAVGLARSSGDPALLVQALVGAIWSGWGPDDLEHRIAAASEAIAAAGAAPSPEPVVHARTARAVGFLERGDLDACRIDLAAAETLAAESRHGLAELLCAQMRVMLALLAGDVAEAETLSAHNLARSQRTSAPQAAAVAGLHLFLVRAAQGRAAELETGLAGMAARSRAMLPRALLAWVRARSGQVEVARRDLRALLLELERRAPDLLWLGTVALLAETAAAVRDVEAAEELLAWLGPYQGRTIVLGMSGGCLGPAARSIGLLQATLGRVEDAVRALEDAVESAKALRAPLCVAQACSDLAAVLAARGRSGDAERAAALRAESDEVLATLGLRVGSPVPPTAPGEALLAAQGRAWRLRFGAREITLPDNRGMRYLARLLERGDAEIHVLELHAGFGGASSAEPLLDPRARAQYRARLDSLREEIEEAERHGDPARRERAEVERAAIERELARAFGLGGRARRLGDDAERARKAVYNRLRDAIARIAVQDPALGRHLERSVRTGTFCRYVPEHPIRWDVRWP